VGSYSISPWSSPAAFNMRWSSIPKEWKPKAGSPADKPGYVRWHPVDGATGYQVWFVNAGKVFQTITNVADEREYWAFHQDAAWTGAVEWRVRAVRTLYGSPQNRLPAVSYGPWSPTYTWVNRSNPLSVSSESYPLTAVSDATSVARSAHPHSLMPAFLFAGDGSSNGYGLHRVYVFSDKDCVNPVFQGAIVGGPAYAPRSTGPLNLPQTSDDLIAAGGKFLKDGAEGDVRRGHQPGQDERGASVVGHVRSQRLRKRHDHCDGQAGEGRPLGSQLAERPLLLDRRPGRCCADTAGLQRQRQQRWQWR
jgi:hypothetical protein